MGSGCPTWGRPPGDLRREGSDRKAALLSPVQVARLCPTPGPAASQTSPTRPETVVPGTIPQSGKQGRRGSDGQGRGRSPPRPHLGWGPYALGPDLLAPGPPRDRYEERPALGPLATCLGLATTGCALCASSRASSRLRLLICEMWLKIDLQVTVRMERQNSSRTFLSIRETGDSP